MNEKNRNTVLTTAILFVFCTNNLCMAHENDYSPTSSLNQGWQQGIEGGIEVAHAIFGDKPELVGNDGGNRR